MRKFLFLIILTGIASASAQTYHTISVEAPFTMEPITVASFPQRDFNDAVCIKAGRNRDAWRLDMPAENIVIRHCTVRQGHSLLGKGSELSGGIRKVYMHDIEAPATVRYWAKRSSPSEMYT